MNHFDVAARPAVRDDAAAHVGWLFPHLPATLRYERMLESQSAPRPGEPDRRCDTIAELVHEGGLGEPWAAVIELFTGPDADASDRLLEYVGRFRRELRHGPHGHELPLRRGAAVPERRPGERGYRGCVARRRQRAVVRPTPHAAGEKRCGCHNGADRAESTRGGHPSLDTAHDRRAYQGSRD